MAVSSWTAIPDDAFDQAVKAKVRDSSNGANIIVLVSLYRIARQAIKQGEYEVDADGNMWFDAGLRLISSYSGVSHNHVSKVIRKLQDDSLIRVCKKQKSRTCYSLVLYSPSIQISDKLYSSGGHSANTVYSSENLKGSLTTLEKKNAKLGTAPKRADPKLANLINRIKAWRPSLDGRLCMFIAIRDKDYMNQALDSIDVNVLNEGDYKDRRLDLGKCWRWLKENNDSLVMEGLEAWEISNFTEFGEDELNPPIWFGTEETKPSEGWIFGLRAYLQAQLRDCSNEDSDMLWKKGFVLASRIHLDNLFKIPDFWDLGVHDEIKELKDFIKRQFDIFEY